MPTRTRLDAELVRRGLARSRQHAGELIAAGRVSIGGITARKLSTAVDAAAAVAVSADGPADDSVSRGAHKLAGALARWPELSVADRRCLDAGASTGGFTQVLLRAGAREVVAVDVGSGQLNWSLRRDPRVHVFDRTNARDLDPTLIDGRVDVVVADLSFISLVTVLPALAGCATPSADFALMVKPQFEVGRGQVGRGGVVRDPQLRVAAVSRVLTAAQDLGLGCAGVVASPLPGPAGNVEYFVWLRPDQPPASTAMVETAVAQGPQ
jgi:23S rRNA (cytidine1920-2'-O)/16S rRNA (cytidine1409-2'-O)-methyltransferase